MMAGAARYDAHDPAGTAQRDARLCAQLLADRRFAEQEWSDSETSTAAATSDSDYYPGKSAPTVKKRMRTSKRIRKSVQAAIH